MLRPIPLPLNDDCDIGTPLCKPRLDATFIEAATRSRKLAIDQSGRGIAAMLNVFSRADLAYVDLPSAHLICWDKLSVTHARYPGVDVTQTFDGKTLLELFEHIYIHALSASVSKLAECTALSQVLSGTDLDLWFEEQSDRIPANHREFDEVIRRQRFVKHNLDHDNIPWLEKRIREINGALIDIRGCSLDGLSGLGLTFDEYPSPTTTAPSSESLLTPPPLPPQGIRQDKQQQQQNLWSQLDSSTANPTYRETKPKVRPAREVHGNSINRGEGRRVGKIVPKFGIIGEERKMKWGVIGEERTRKG
ncbi:hypothetical protein DL96DRAFT_1774277 [Flagelloscypha sp. PMI_526]|nr:hypothetical protein DL96DRAFT_1774277 [Flagelloscypha sp. PMI_526]